MDANTMEAVCDYILKNINEYIDIDQIDNEFHYSKFHLMRKFKEYTGITINEYLNKNRIYNSSLTKNQVKKLEKDFWLNCQKALEDGIVDKIIEIY